MPWGDDGPMDTTEIGAARPAVICGFHTHSPQGGDMAELLDRNIQHDLLRAMQDTYPTPTSAETLQPLAPGNALRVNLSYLEEHGLLDIKGYSTFDGDHIASARINARGLGFLADDGGLGAILGVITVKLHQDTVRDLLIERVQAANTDSSVKRKLIDQLRSLPASELGRLTSRAVDAGLRQLPDAAQWLQTALSNL